MEGIKVKVDLVDFNIIFIMLMIFVVFVFFFFILVIFLFRMVVKIVNKVMIIRRMYMK